MKAITLKNRIAKSNNANGTTPNNDNYRLALAVLIGGKEHTSYYSGSGKWTSIKERCPEIYLRAWGIDFEAGNDAPKGGKIGNYITLSKKGLTQTKAYRQELKEAAEKVASEKKARIEAQENAIINNVLANLDFFKTCEDKNKRVQKACKNDFALGFNRINELITKTLL